MRIPTIRGIIDRRVLVNFRVDPDVLARVCPPPFRPQTVNGFGVAGICLIRLKQIRPKALPAFLGISSENAAHRIAVEWDTDEGTQTGVYIPKRNTSSLLNALAGGRIFPGVHGRANFEVDETENDFNIAMKSTDGSTHVSVTGSVAQELPEESIFDSVAQCSQFFEDGSLGYSPAAASDQFDGLELRAINWKVNPLAISDVSSSFFDDLKTFPEGSATFDNALLMRDIHHEWHSREFVCCEAN